MTTLAMILNMKISMMMMILIFFLYLPNLLVVLASVSGQSSEIMIPVTILVNSLTALDLKHIHIVLMRVLGGC